MFESDADRLEMIKSLGGQLIECEAGNFWAVFDAEFAEVLSDPSVETTSPALSAARTSDVLALGINANTDVRVAGAPYRVRRHQPDGTGMSVLPLKRA